MALVGECKNAEEPKSIKGNIEVKSVGMERHSVTVGIITDFVETDLYVSRSRH